MITKAEIKMVRSLADKRGRGEHGLFVAEGEKIIRELHSSPLRVVKIYAPAGVMEDLGGDVCRVTDSELERMSMLKTANNSLAVVEMPRHAFDLASAGEKLVLALDDVSNPGNLGTMIRLADWFGIEDVVCSRNTADCFNPKVVQATMGAIIRVRVHYCDLPQLLRDARGRGIEVCGTFLDGENVYTSELPAAGFVVMGNEGRGISDACGAYVSRRLHIPSYPAGRTGSESLNVSAAAAVVCSEFRRRMHAAAKP